MGNILLSLRRVVRFLFSTIPVVRLRIPSTVSESVVSIGTSPSGDFLLLADSKNKTLEMVKIAFVVDIDISGLPFKGPANAPVVVAVFSDYQ